MMLILRLAILLVALLIAPLPLPAETNDSVPGRMVILYFENDAFIGTDYLYTNGIKLAYTSGSLECRKDGGSPGDWALPLARRLPMADNPEFNHGFSLAVGQSMYTPEDTQNPYFIEGDRPYAGLTYFEMSLVGQSKLRADSWELILGIIGPHAYAGDTQRAFHDWNGWEGPKGWAHQLRDEPVLNLFFTRKRKILRSNFGRQWGFDAIPSWGVGLGNLYIGAQVGAQVRLGWNLPADFGTSLIRPGSSAAAPVCENPGQGLGPSLPFGVHLFAGADGCYVLKNLTLDGNTFEKSHSVPKEMVVGSFMAGLGITFDQWKISFAHVYQTREFKGQKDPEEFGSLTINRLF